MQPFETLGLPSPAECPGIAGLVVSVVTALVGVVWVVSSAGGPPAFLLVVASGLLGWLSFMYCVVWEGSWPVG